jgi:hypothetical protein
LLLLQQGCLPFCLLLLLQGSLACSLLLLLGPLRWAEVTQTAACCALLPVCCRWEALPQACQGLQVLAAAAAACPWA